MKRAHRLFAVACLVLGATLLAFLFVIALGAAGIVSDAYFALTTALLPVAWRDEWLALPSIVHVGIGMLVGAILVGAASELLDE